MRGRQVSKNNSAPWPICRNFNHGRCGDRSCRYHNVCLDCNGSYPRVACGLQVTWISVLFSGSRSQPSGFPRHWSHYSDSPATGLAFAQLVPVVQQLLAAGIAPSTRRVYTSGAHRYQEFSHSIGMEAYPVLERSLLMFVSCLQRI